jgi:hypothetical protein
VIQRRSSPTATDSARGTAARRCRTAPGTCLDCSGEGPVISVPEVTFARIPGPDLACLYAVEVSNDAMRYVPPLRRHCADPVPALAAGAQRCQLGVCGPNPGSTALPWQLHPNTRTCAQGAPTGWVGTGMIARLARTLRRMLSQDVARRNAAQASIRIQHHRRQVEDAEAYVARRLDRKPNGARGRSHSRSSRPEWQDD